MSLPLFAFGFAALKGAAASIPALSANSWGPNRIDVFGVYKQDVWHKYHDAGGFEPSVPPVFEDMGGSVMAAAPALVSWGVDRTDYFAVDTNGTAAHKYWDGSQWNPSSSMEQLFGANEYTDFSGQLAACSWQPGRLDVVGQATNGSYLHLYYDASGSNSWEGWESFGGNFSSAPAVLSWGPNRLDVFGISGGSLLHKYYDGSAYQPGPGPDDWENLGSPSTGKFVGTPVVSSWAAGRLDVWVAGDDGALYHAYWHGYSEYQGFENLGGNFSTAPQVVHWSVDRTDIVGQFQNDPQYQYKFGYVNPGNGQWEWQGWWPKGGNFVSQPAITSWEANDLNILGIDSTGTLLWQFWIGGNWNPSTGYYTLGNASDPFASSAEWHTTEGQIVMDSFKEDM